MRRYSKQKITATVLPTVLLGATCVFVGCHTRDADEGSIRVNPAQVIGAYTAKFNNGSERLELKADGTYIQDFNSHSRPFRHTGNWRNENVFLDGSEVLLSDAAVTEEDETRPLAFGELGLYTHDRSGKVALARNEIADWYYEPTK